ncbi:MAG: hypothetical protein AAF587_37035 [Bacteroidota bacterium]
MANLEIHFLDVGQGDGTFIIFPDGKTTMLVDLGSLKNGKIAGADALKFLWYSLKEIHSKSHAVKSKLKPPTINFLFITHPDPDHYNLIPSLIGGSKTNNSLPTPYRCPLVKVEDCYIGGKLADYSNHNSIHSFLKLLKPPKKTKKRNRLHVFQKGGGGTIIKEYKSGLNKGLKIHLLGVNNPGTNHNTESNSNSIVLMLEYGGTKIILPGDAESNVETIIANRYQNNQAFLQSRALKLGHHGSKQATSRNWINIVQPETIFASGDLRWSHPYCEVFKRFKTDQNNSQFDNNVDYITTRNDLNHGFVCGNTNNADYEQHSTKAGIFTNLSKSPNAQNSVTVGEQVLLQIQDDGEIAISMSNMNNPSAWF